MSLWSLPLLSLPTRFSVSTSSFIWAFNHILIFSVFASSIRLCYQRIVSFKQTLGICKFLGSRSLTSSASWAEKQFKLYAWAVWQVTWGPANHKHRSSYTALCSAHPGTPMNRLKTCFSLGWSEKSSQLGLMIEVKIKYKKGKALSQKNTH